MNQDKLLYFDHPDILEGLYLDLVFLELEGEPILFTCRNGAGELFLCACLEMRGVGEWVVARTNRDILRSMFDGRLSIREALLTNKSDLFRVLLPKDGTETVYPVLYTCADSLNLPAKNSFLEYRSAEAVRYFSEENVLFTGDLGAFTVKPVESDSAEFIVGININPRGTIQKNSFHAYLDTLFSELDKADLADFEVTFKHVHFDEEHIDMQSIIIAATAA